MDCAWAWASSTAAAWLALSPVSDIRAAMSPETMGVAKDVPLQRAIPVKSRSCLRKFSAHQLDGPLLRAMTSFNSRGNFQTKTFRK